MSVMAGNPLVIVQARLDSTRFPEKILADLHGKPVLQHVLDRCREIEGIADVVVAVPHERDRQRLLEHGIASIAVPSVSENDVLGRFAWLVQQWTSHQIIARVTSDCPMLDPRACEAVLARFTQGDCDYCSNAIDGEGPQDGTDFEVFSRDALLTAHEGADSAFAREHVSPWMKDHLRVAYVDPPFGTYVSIDTPEDLERVRALLDGRQ